MNNDVCVTSFKTTQQVLTNSLSNWRCKWVTPEKSGHSFHSLMTKFLSRMRINTYNITFNRIVNKREQKYDGAYTDTS